MSLATLQLRGSYWKDLSESEQQELLAQLPKLQNDPNYVKYRFLRTRYNKWIILNAMCLPLKISSNRKVFVNNEQS